MGSLDGARSLALLAATRPERVGGLIAFSPIGARRRRQLPRARGLRRAGSRGSPDWPGPLPGLYAPHWADDPVRDDRLKRYFQTS